MQLAKRSLENPRYEFNNRPFASASILHASTADLRETLEPRYFYLFHHLKLVFKEDRGLSTKLASLRDYGFQANFRWTEIQYLTRKAFLKFLYSIWLKGHFYSCFCFSNLALEGKFSLVCDSFLLVCNTKSLDLIEFVKILANRLTVLLGVQKNDTFYFYHFYFIYHQHILKSFINAAVNIF